MAVAVNAAASCIGAFIMAFVYGPLMALICCLIVPLNVFVGIQLSMVRYLYF